MKHEDKYIKRAKQFFKLAIAIFVLGLVGDKLWPYIKDKDIFGAKQIAVEGSGLPDINMPLPETGRKIQIFTEVIPDEVDMNYIPVIGVDELNRQIQSETPPVLLDVREPYEWDIALIPGSVKIPLGELPSRYEELPKDRAIVVVCHTGNRSARATAFLMGKKFFKVHSLTGGIAAWANEIDRDMRAY